MKKLFLTISANTIENSTSALFERLRFNEATTNVWECKERDCKSPLRAPPITAKKTLFLTHPEKTSCYCYLILVITEQKDLINLLIGELVSTYDRHVNVSQMREKVTDIKTVCAENIEAK
uniref:Uncharacterized protein n=1 Tax=Glossina austeni TaxID=7395 RepID=A0A1A9UD84_GLOAU